MIFAANLKCNHTRASFLEYTRILDEFLEKFGGENSGEKFRGNGEKINGENFQNSQNFKDLKNATPQNFAQISTQNSKNPAQNFQNSQNFKTADKIIVFPPFSAFLDQNLIKNFTLGAQNFYPCESGSFTGEIGAEILGEFGIKTALIGHSERREIFGESDGFLKEKFNFAKSRGWEIIFCVGEDDITHMNASTHEFLADQLSIIDLNYENLTIAYEPIWAIGTGKSASDEIIADALEFISSLTPAPLLYGGSVNENNIAQIKKIPHCSGVLIGKAAWDAQNFIKIINS